MPKDYFIIGDVHGCLNTFQILVDRHWDKASEILIQLGDLIDRGAYSPQTVLYCMKLEELFPDNTIFLRGNHEQMLLDYYDDISTSWLSNGGFETLHQFETADLDIKSFLPWIEKRRLYNDTDSLFISHAGISLNDQAQENPRHAEGLLWNRSKLKNIGKPQIIGHTPLNTGKPLYTAESNSWNIDTGAYKGICLTGIKMGHQGNFKNYRSVPTHEEDLL